MIPQLFSSRTLFLVILTWMMFFTLSACGGGGVTTESPSDIPTHPPAVTHEAPGITSTPPVTKVDAQPALLETRRLTLEFPPKIKADSESDIVRLTLEVDDLGNITPTAFYQGNTITGEVVKVPNLY
ncbi:MAG: hypothetical protein HC797_04500, partial [Anaerolineales bacterium]|nr:hypothetical protein [Anaerolineales bacterium]